jgi:nucleoside-diphosphate-sugar epimerase
MTTPDPPSDWNGRVAAVTGASGFFGSHLVEGLLAAGAEVRALVRYNSSGDTGMLRRLRPGAQPQVTFGDIRNSATLPSLVTGADVVYHLAALISVPHSYADPSGYVQTNVHGTVNVLDACRTAGVGRVVTISSSEVYGTAQHDLIGEPHPLVAQSPYAATKIAAEKLCESYVRSYGMPIVTVRPFNLYGPRQSRRAVIPEIVAQALQSDVLHIGSVEAYRDFNYVADTVNALLRVGLAAGLDGRVFNIGSGRSTQISEVVDTVGELLGRSLTVEVDADRLRPPASEVRRLCADSTALRREVGEWPLTGLDVGLAAVIADMRSRTAAPAF